jgi:N-acetylglucosaminyl-diphospho-decaprenol L-rhamnosyltransferase
MDVTVIIVSYNTSRLIVDCLESVQNASGAEKEIFVVDNASSDKSTAIISARFPDVILITNQENKGFSAANNQALRNCCGRYVVFLNPDTTIAPDALQKALFYMETNQQIGLAGARIINPDGSLQPSISYKYPGEKFASDELIDLHGNIACVLGAFMIARKSLLDELCGFDEDFFLYGEDQDLCWRIRKRGFTIGYINDAEVLHWGGQSEVKTPPVDLFTKKLKAEYLFYQKHYSPKTIARIRKSQRLKAGYRLATLKWAAPFVRNKAAHRNKMACYEISLKMAES